MKVTPFVLVLGARDVYFCSDERKKVKPYFLKGEGIGQVLAEFALAARLSFVHSFMRSVNKCLVRACSGQMLMGSGATVGSNIEESLCKISIDGNE